MMNQFGVPSGGATDSSDLYDGEDVLNFYGMAHVDRWTCLGYFGVCLTAIWALMLVPLAFVDWRKCNVW